MAESGNYKSETLRRFERAAAKRRQWDGLLDDAYRYALPNHDPRGSDTRGTQRDADVYDNTAVNAVQWKKARLHGQLFPFREWMDFAPPGVRDWSDDDKKRYQDHIATARQKFHEAIEISNFHIEIDPSLGDACVSTGCLMVHKGTPENPLRFEAVPVAQLIPEEGPDGMIKTLFREWKVPGRQLMDKWPDAKLPEQVKQDIEKDPDADLSVVEALLHNYGTERCRYEVWLLGAAGGNVSGEHKMVDRTYDVGLLRSAWTRPRRMDGSRRS